MSGKGATRFELWKVGTGHAFFPVTNEAAHKLLPPGAKLVWTVEAESWDEARARMHRFLGWQPYKPVRSSAVPEDASAGSSPEPSAG